MTLAWLLALDPKTVAAVISILVGLTTLGGIAWKYALKPVWGFALHAKACLLKAESYMLLLEEIEKELRPNGGGSLRDAINRLEVSVAVNGSLAQMVANKQGIHAWKTTKSGEWEWVSPAYCEAADLTFNELLGTGWINSVHQDDRTKVLNEWELAIADNRNFHGIYRLATDVKVHARAERIISPKGDTVGWIGSLSLV